MKKTKKRVVLIILILIALLGGLIFSMSYKNKEEVKTNKIDSYIDYIFDRKIHNTEEEIENIKNDVNDILQESSNKEIISKSNLILGHIDMINSDDKGAIEKYKEAIENFTSNIKVHIKLAAHYELSKAYLNQKEYEKSYKEFDKVIELGKKKEYEGVIIHLSILRSYDLYNSEIGVEGAIEFMHDISKMAKELDYELTYKTYFQLGVLYWYANSSVESINYKLKALNIVEEKQLNSDIAEILVDIGIDYIGAGNYDEALKYLLRGLEYDVKDKSDNGYIKSYAILNLVDCYNKLNDFENSRKYFEMFDKYIYDYENENNRNQFITVMNLYRSDYEIRTGNLTEALRLLNLSKSQYEEAKAFYFYNFEILLNETYGDLNYNLGEYEEALKYHKEAERLVSETEIAYPRENLNDKIYLDYKALGDNENTIKYLEKNNELKSEIAQRNNRKYSQYLLNEFESEKNTKTILQLKNQRRNMLGFIIILFAVTCLIGVFVIIISIKNKEIVRLNELFKSLSVTDGLTQISNRRALDELLSKNWNEYINKYIPISFIMIDIDYFKKYNDNYGHLEGDKILKDVADTIKKSCKSTDFVSRYGGEEFIIILLKTEKSDVISIIERIQKNIHDLNLEHKYSEVSDRITLSIGVSISNYGGNRSYEEYIKEADEALYTSKERGRNTYTFFDDIKNNK